MGMVIYSMNSTLIVHKDPFIACKGLVSNTPGKSVYEKLNVSKLQIR